MKKLYFLLLFCLLLSVETIAQITTHIVGGDDTDIDEVPWQVLIENQYTIKWDFGFLWWDYYCS